MKRIALATVVASALFAGPDMGILVDYDAQDEKIAQTQEKEQIEPAPIVAPLVTAPAPVMKKSCCTNRDSIDLIGGYNFTEDDGALDDAATLGIRYNKNIAPNTYIQAGYERVFSSDYRTKNNLSRLSYRSVPDGNNGNGNGNGNGNDNGNGTESDNSPNGSTTNSSNTKNTSNIGSTQLDRFYLNGLYEFCNDKKLMPYIFAGFGYENVRHESYNLESGGFFDTGAGLKYQLNSDINLITEARALKKFDNSDLDITTALGLGFVFGATHAESIESVELDTSIEPKPDVIPSIIPADAPIASITETEIPYSYDNDKDYENLDVVPIDEINRKNSYHSNDANLQDTEPAYYIQIAALFSNNSTDSSYIQKLDEQGLNPQLKETTVRGKPVKLLLAGPYSSKAKAKADLSRAKQIEKGAFIKKIDG
jgi:hypothetical protein